VQTINLATALPDITGSLTINGPGANLLTVQRAFNAATEFRIFTIPAGIPQVAISGITISNGNSLVGSEDFGAGISSLSNLNLTNVHTTGNQARIGGGIALQSADGVFTGCTISGNLANAGSGGGIYFEGSGGRTLRVVNSTVSGNSSADQGGGIANIGSVGNSRLEVTNSTIADNAALNGGGISTFTQNGAGNTATTTLRNTIIAGNSPNNLATGTFNGGAAIVSSNGFNLSDNYSGAVTLLASDLTAQPVLGPLAANGGPTPTHALLFGSPALDKGNRSGALSDQRGQVRPFDIASIAPASGGDNSNIGAFEAQSAPLAPLIFANGFEN